MCPIIWERLLIPYPNWHVIFIALLPHFTYKAVNLNLTPIRVLFFCFSFRLYGLMKKKKLLRSNWNFIFFNFFLRFIYLFMRDTDWDRGRDIEGEAGFSQGAWCGTRSWIPGSWPELKAGAQPLSHPGVPSFFFFLLILTLLSTWKIFGIGYMDVFRNRNRILWMYCLFYKQAFD